MTLAVWAWAGPLRAQIISNDSFLGFSSKWQGWPGTNEPPAGDPGWLNLGYKDTDWRTIQVPLSLDTFGLQENPGLRDMRGRYTTLFLRRTFNVTDTSRYDVAHLYGYLQGGCVVWINGREVARTLVPPDPIALTAVALPRTNFDSGSLDVQLPISAVHAGTNVIAVRVLNTALSSDQLYFAIYLDGSRDRTPPMVDRLVPEPETVRNSLSQIEVVFSEPVTGVDAADLLVNGEPATAVTEPAAGNFVFTLPPVKPGVATVSFRTDHGITDRSSSSNALVSTGPWKYFIDPAARLESIRITEFLADNGRGIRDEDGSREDWIELRNLGAEPASLEGWGLGLDPGGAGRWKFPARVMQPGEYLVVFASGKNRTEATGTLHTDFKLPKAGGTLLLFKPDGTVAGGFPSYPPQVQDRSYGTVIGNSGAQGFFVTPTPGGPNSDGGIGFASPVLFSASSQSYSGALSLTLHTSDPTAAIHYTLDQSEPVESSPVYSAPLVLAKMTMVRARAIAPGLLPGPVHTESYFPVAPSLASFTSTLPVIVINDFGGGRPPLGYRIPSHLQVFEPGADGVTRLLTPPTLTTRAGIATRGSSTAGNPKPNLRLEFWDEAEQDRKLPLLGLPEEADWILYAPGGFDPALINNAYAHELSRSMGRYSPRTRFVEVFLVTDGDGPLTSAQYGGVYVLEERIELGKSRVDVDRVAPGATTEPEVTGGYLFKIDRASGSEGVVNTIRQQVLVLEPSGSELTPPQQTWLNTYFKSFETALYGVNFRDPVLGFRPYVDAPSWIDHHLINVLLFNVDALRLSAFFYKTQGGPLAFGPLWDFDRAMRSTDGRDFSPRVWRSQTGDLGTDFFNYIWWAKLFRDPDFFQEYTDRYQQLRQGAFSLAALHELVDRLSSQVAEAQPRDAVRWGNHTRGGYAKEIRDLKAWISNRVDFMDNQMVRLPIARTNSTSSGLMLDFETAAGLTVYVTTDGTDPRAPGGDISLRAQTWNGSLQVRSNLLVTARAFSATAVGSTGINNPPLASHWSAPVKVVLQVGASPLRITEINFNPGKDTAVGDEQELEFIELWNASAASVDLSHFRIRGGVQFDWPRDASSIVPAGSRVLVARNPALLRQRISGLTGAFGPYTGHLSNSSDVVELQDEVGVVVQRLEYSDAWVPAADGGGYSLVPAFEGSDDASFLAASNWVRSALPGGSPGTLDGSTIPDMAPTVQTVPSGIRLRFVGARGRAYTVSANDDPTRQAGWKVVTTLTAPTGTGVLEWSEPASGSTRFYRVTAP